MQRLRNKVRLGKLEERKCQQVRSEGAIGVEENKDAGDGRSSQDEDQITSISKRVFIKTASVMPLAAYVTPAITSYVVAPAYAKHGSEKPSLHRHHPKQDKDDEK